MLNHWVALEMGFSLRAGFRITASWLVIRRPRARSTLAPRASLPMLSVFSAVGTKRCCVRGLFSRRSRPSRRLRTSAMRGSPLAMLPFDEAIEGAPLTVENRLEARFYSACCQTLETIGDEYVVTVGPLTDCVMIGRSESREVCLAIAKSSL